MKLITELTQEVQYLFEGEEGKKSLYIEGVFLQGNIKNRNGRIYPTGVLENEVGRYNEEYVKRNTAYGELGHPDGPKINPDRISHRIVSLRREGNNFIGKAKVLNEGLGKIAHAIIADGGQLGVSSRGLGSLKPNSSGVPEVQEDFKLCTAADIVTDPSAPDAFVRGIMENCQWVYDAASGDWRRQQIVEQVKKMDKRQLEEQTILMFRKFISTLTK